MSDTKERYQRAVINGARKLSKSQWSLLVSQACDELAAGRAELYGTSELASVSPAPARRKHVVLHAGQMVVDAQTILDVEAALAMADELADEIRSLAIEDVDRARRARLMKTLEAAKETVARRLARGQS